MKYKVKDFTDLREKVATMDVDALLYSVIIPDIHSGSTVDYRNVGVFVHTVTAREAENFTSGAKVNADHEMVFVADLESGAGDAILGATKFPMMRAVGVANDETLAYRMGEICAVEGRAVGYSWTFAPCVDICTNHDNSIVSSRSVGEDTEQVIRIGGAYMRGLQEHGVVATLKHFPGDGPCRFDQHLTATENPLSMEQWYATFGRVYRELIDQGAKTIMPGHISLPAYDEIDPETGIYPPATLSKRLLTDLLKKELGFEGIIVSDATVMGGFCGYINYYEACARFLEAGGDCLLFVNDIERVVANLKKLIERGKLSVETLRDRAYRMLCFAREVHTEEYINRKISKEEARAISDEIVEKACKIIRNRKNLLPYKLTDKTKILHLVFSNNYPPEYADDLTNELKKITEHVDVYIDAGPKKNLSLAEDGGYDLIICTVGVNTKPGWNTARLHGAVARNMMDGWSKIGPPAIFVNYGHPHWDEEYMAADTIINTHGYTEHTASVVVKRIIGEQEMERL